MLDMIWVLVWFSSLVPHSFCPYIGTLGTYVLRTDLSSLLYPRVRCTPWHAGMAADLT